MSKPVDSNIAQAEGRHEEPLASKGNLAAIASDCSVREKGVYDAKILCRAVPGSVSSLDHGIWRRTAS